MQDCTPLKICKYVMNWLEKISKSEFKFYYDLI